MMDKNERTAELRSLAKGIADAMTAAYIANDRPAIRAAEECRDRLAAEAIRDGFTLKINKGPEYDLEAGGGSLPFTVSITPRWK
ncbi:MAG: hypothetical protein ABI876_16700 [Bacteroidota bacterium]